MSIKNALANIDVLIADSDSAMATIVIHNLKAMGLRKLHHVKNGEAALEFIKTNHIDVLITEWTMAPMDGLTLVNHLRRDPGTPNRLLPIIMLTGKGEVSDVEMARDHGITEFVVKPFTAKSLYTRIEQLVDYPRSFIVSANYVGPDRRRRMQDANYKGPERRLGPDGKDRRRQPPRERAANQLTPGVPNEPEMVAPMHTLKRAIGIAGPLSSVITPQMIAAAQQTINNMQDETLKWLREDLNMLEEALRQCRINPNAETVGLMKEASMSIKSRGGTFGRNLASKVARLLYLFLSAKCDPKRASHQMIIEKHIDALKVAIMIGDGNEVLARELLMQLEKLAEK